MPCFKSCTYLCLTFCLFLANAPLLADEDAYQRQPGDHQVHYRDLHGPALEELLRPSELSAYYTALAEDDCNSAYALLTNAYALEFPDEPHPGSSIKATVDWDVYIAPHYYMDLALCLELRQISEARQQIARDGLEVERLSEARFMSGLWNGKRKPRPVSNLDSAFRGLLILSGRKHGPTVLALVKLSEEGEVIRFTNEYQYYGVLRARIFGVDSVELDELTARAAARLDPATRREIEQQAENAIYTFSDIMLE